jgi:hypothetical protein
MVSSLKGGKYLALIAFLLAVLSLIYFNFFYLTGYGYAELCWKATQVKSSEKSTDFKDVITRAKFNEQSKQCELIANRAMFGRGYVIAGNPDYAVTTELKEIQKYCPKGFNELPFLGLHYWVIKQVEAGQSLEILDRFLPARFFIERMIDKKWGQCPEVRAKVGIPHLVESSDGTWIFESECIPCKAEIKAAEDINNRASRPLRHMWESK